MATDYPRDMIGYGRTPPSPAWPDGARIAVQFVINYEEGGENCILHGDAASEAFLSEIVGAEAWPGARHMNMESIYEYGSRVGFWRLWRMFTDRGIPATVFASLIFCGLNSKVVILFSKILHVKLNHNVEYPALVPTSIHFPLGDAAAIKQMNLPVSGGIWRSLSKCFM